MAEKEMKTTSAAEEIALLQKKYGKTSIMKMSDTPDIAIDAFSTGNIKIDLAIGIGGIPRGRITEIFGPESSGKSTLALQVIAEAQKRGETCAYIDAEYALDRAYAIALGVDLDNLYISQPDYGEQALDITIDLARSGHFGVIVVDSVAALTPKAEIEGEMTDANVAAAPRMMSKAMRKLNAAVGQTGTCMIFINQLREKVGVMFGSPEHTPGGRALRFYASVRIDLRKKTNTKDGGEIIGNEVNVKIAKNKVAPPFKETLVQVVYGQGFSRADAVLDTGASFGVIGKSGGTYTTSNGEKLGTSKAKSIAYLNENPDILDELYAEVMDFIKSAETIPEVIVEDDDE